MDFSDILASSIHDIKNSLGMILNNLDDLIANPENHIKDPRQARLLQHEARRVNGNLIQLLTLYKLGHAELIVHVAEYNLEDFLDEVIADNHAVCNALDIQIDQSCAPSLCGYFDSELVRNVLDNAIGNARRYTKSRILLSAAHENDGLVIRVEDDGTGFPVQLIGRLDPAHPLQRKSEGINRTRLGHYFSAQIASLHKTSNRQGYIQLTNKHELTGGCLELWLP